MESLHHIIQSSSVPESTPPPVLLLLHGYGSNETDLMGLSPYLDRRLVKVSARAPMPMDYGGNAWFPLEVNQGGIALQFVQARSSIDLIASLVRDLKSKYQTKRILLLGFSQGATMALSAAFSHPGLCEGVAALSGVVVPEMLPSGDRAHLRDFPVIVTHGRNDQIIPIAQGRSSHRLLTSLPLALDYREYEMGHEINQACLADVNAWLTARIDVANRQEIDAE